MRSLRSSFSLSILPMMLFACAGGGGGSCSGIEPMEGAFPEPERIANAAQIRLTDSGIAYLENNVDSLLDIFFPQGLDFPLSSTPVGPLTVCSDNDCSVHIEVTSVDLIPTGPNTLRVALSAKLDSRNSKNGLPGMHEKWTGSCDIEIQTNWGSRNYVKILADVVFKNDTQAARRGYTYIDVQNVAISDTEGVENDDIDLSGGFLGSCNLGDIGFIKSWIIDQIKNQVSGVAGDAVNGFLCTKPTNNQCPDGTYNVDGTCRYANNEDARCVPLLLGYQGQGNLGQALLSSFAPNAEGSVQFTVAAGGEAEAVNDGMTIYGLGGMRSTDESFAVSPRHHECVPQVAHTPPTIARASIFRGNTIPGGMSDAHLGIGLAEAFLDHAGYALYDSGLLCLGAGTELSQQVSTGVLSFLIGSVPRVTFPARTAALSVELRPQKPPTFEVGKGTEDDPILTMTLADLDVHLYAFSQERYIRFMTLRGDLHIALEVSVSGSTVNLTIADLQVTNAVVSNSDILAEDPEKLAETLQAILSGLGGQLASAIPSFELPSIMGLEVQIPPDGIVGVESSGEEFLALYGTLKVPGGSPLVSEADTEAAIESLSFDENLLHDGAQVEVIAEGIGLEGSDFEYSYRVNENAWSPWTANSNFLVNDPVLRLEARHLVQVRARYADVPASADPEPTTLVALVDKTPPLLTASRDAEGLLLAAHDFVSDKRSLRLRLTSGAVTTGWLPFEERPAFELIDEALVIEVEDETSNRTAVQLAAATPTTNAQPGSPRTAGCSVSRNSQHDAFWGALALTAVLSMMRRRAGRTSKRALSSILLALALAVFAVGCSCSEGPNGGPMNSPDSGPDGSTVDGCGGRCGPPQGSSSMGSACCASTDMCVLYDLTMLCDSGFVCAGAEAVTLDENCSPTCVNCVPPPELAKGHIGSYLDALVQQDGQVIFSAYNAGIPPSLPFGDLVVGVYDETNNEVLWETVDGLPTEGAKQYDPDGWRQGYGLPGDDVGRWTSITESDGLFYVSYHDVTNGSLKVASGTPGNFVTHVVDDEGIAGRHSSIVSRADGKLVIAYNEVGYDEDGTVRSRVRAAHSANQAPASTEDWTVVDIAEKVVDCRPWMCGGFGEDAVCLENGKCALETTDCSATCKSGQSCVSGSCVASVAPGYLEAYEQGVGLHNDLQLDGDGLALAYYDSVSGAVRLVRYIDEEWKTPVLIDGIGSSANMGAHPSLFVDANGVYHIAYYDLVTHSLHYATRDSTTERELVDDGISADGQAYSDGRHWVGTDPALVVLPSGEIRIAYQDQSAQRTLLATRAAGENAWVISTLDAEPHTGFFSVQRLRESGSQVFSWWRAGGSSNDSGVRVHAVP